MSNMLVSAFVPPCMPHCMDPDLTLSMPVLYVNKGLYIAVVNGVSATPPKWCWEHDLRKLWHLIIPQHKHLNQHILKLRYEACYNAQGRWTKETIGAPQRY